MSRPPAAGQVIADRYELRDPIGRGGMGVVWRAEHRTLRTPVAIKLLTGGTDADSLARFSREARAAASLRSPNVVQILDHGVDDGTPYIAMELLEGESLGTRLRRVGKLTPGEAARVLEGVVLGIARAHRVKVIHRDLKPDNIFITRDEETGVEIVKVLDFGIAKHVQPDGDGATGAPTNSGVILGTPFYMSPEQARGKKDIDHRSDLWSIGVIAYECLLGERPFSSDAIGELMMQICVEDLPVPSARGSVPSGFDAWFARAMKREPDARFQTVRELAAALAEVLTPGRPWLEPTTDSSGARKSDVGPLVDEVALAPTAASPVSADAASPVAAGNASTEKTTSHSIRVDPKAASESGTRGRGLWIAVVAVVAIGGLGGVMASRPSATPSSGASPAPSAAAPPASASASSATPPVATAAPPPGAASAAASAAPSASASGPASASASASASGRAVTAPSSTAKPSRPGAAHPANAPAAPATAAPSSTVNLGI
ncbi:MAG: serine/threonine protein kinase [Deltaproteobacteria bacterium]|nr:serine/threonine protein kinase [Deltaproteobacteria bacterium]